MATTSTSLAVDSREAQSSRDARRGRRTGLVPGVVYGGGVDPRPFAVDDRVLRNALAASGSVIELAIDGGTPEPVVLKDAQRHPVRGHLMHVDLLRVDLKQKIQQPVSVVLLGAEEAEGAKAGGVVEHILREVTVEALPADFPESLEIDVQPLEIGDNRTVADLDVPSALEIVDEPDAVVVSITAPRIVRTDDGEIEVEVVGGATSDEIAAVEEGGAEAGAESSEPSEGDDAPGGDDAE